MAKNNFLLSDEWESMFTALPDEKAGQLIKAAFKYHAGEEASIDDPVLDAVLCMVKAKIDENEKKYAEICQKRAEAAKAKDSKSEQKQANATNDEQVTPDNEYDNDSDSDNDSEYVLNTKQTGLKKKHIKHKYGEYKHVLLTDDEYQRLCSEHGELVIQKAIQVVDEYCQTSGKTYKDYNLVLRKWGIERAKNGDRQKGRDSPYLEAIRNRVDIVDTWV